MRDYTEIVGSLREAPEDWSDKELHYRAADAIEELLAAVPKWISVEERLPRKYENVITADKHGHVQWNYLINEKHGTWSTGYHITHWMPLPEAPKEVE